MRRWFDFMAEALFLWRAFHMGNAGCRSGNLNSIRGLNDPLRIARIRDFDHDRPDRPWASPRKRNTLDNAPHHHQFAR